MAIRNEELLSGSVPRRQPPIEYVTENGFSIIRRSDVETHEVHGAAAARGCSSGTDTAHKCRFLVRNEGGRQREVTVHFDEHLIAQIQRQRRTRLLDTSVLWLICAEKCLATYLWENDNYPDGGRLSISELSLDQSLLAKHWSDQQGD